MAVQYYALDAASARSATPTTATTEDGAGTAPKVIKVVGLDVESTSAGLLAPGDVLLAIDGGAPLGDDLRAVDVQLTKALVRDGIAIITVSREGSSLDIPVPVVDLDAARTTRAATFAGCTFQDVPLADVPARFPMIDPEELTQVLETEGAGMLFPARIMSDLIVLLSRRGVGLHAYSRVDAVDPDRARITAATRSAAAAVPASTIVSVKYPA